MLVGFGVGQGVGSTVGDGVGESVGEGVGLLVGLLVGCLVVGAGLGGISDSESPLRKSISNTLLNKGFSCNVEERFLQGFLKFLILRVDQGFL